MTKEEKEKAFRSIREWAGTHLREFRPEFFFLMMGFETSESVHDVVVVAGGAEGTKPADKIPIMVAAMKKETAHFESLLRAGAFGPATQN